MTYEPPAGVAVRRESRLEVTQPSLVVLEGGLPQPLLAREELTHLRQAALRAIPESGEALGEEASRPALLLVEDPEVATHLVEPLPAALGRRRNREPSAFPTGYWRSLSVAATL